MDAMSKFVETIKNRAKFYKDGETSAKRINHMLAAGLVISILFSVVVVAAPPAERYIPMGPGCAVQEIIPLDKPYLTTADVIEYAADTAIGSYTFSAANFSRDLGSTKKRFTPEGWSEWNDAITANGVLNYVVRHAAMVTAYTSDEAPVVVNEGLGIASGNYADRYAWEVKVPFRVTYLSANNKVPQQLEARVIVIRRPYSDDPFFKGLGVTSLIVRQG